MVSIEVVERGVARYIDEAILPNIQSDGIKGFAMGMAATVLVKRGGNLLREYAKTPMLQQLGIVTAEGAVDLDLLRDAAKKNMPSNGLSIDAPMGIVIRINGDDIDQLCEMIRKEGCV